MYNSIISRFLSPLIDLPIDENKATTASLNGITPPDDIDIEIRNAMIDMNNPKNTISLNLFFFSSISDSSGLLSISDLNPLYPFFN